MLSNGFMRHNNGLPKLQLFRVKPGEYVHSEDAEERTRMAEIILTCAKEIVERVGYERLKLATVARDVGITVPAIYHHYPSRQSLLDAVRADNMVQANKFFGERQSRLLKAIAEQDRHYYDAIVNDFTLDASDNDYLTFWGKIAEILLSQQNTPFYEAVRTSVSKSIKVDLGIVAAAQELGWINPELDTTSVVALAISYCIGLSVVRRIPILQPKSSTIDDTAKDLLAAFL